MKKNINLFAYLLEEINIASKNETLINSDKFKSELYSFTDVFFHAEALYKFGYIGFFQHIIKPDYSNSFIVGNLTKKGKEAYNMVSNKKKLKLLINGSISNVLKQNLSFYFPADVDGTLFRYMSLNKLDLLLRDKAIYFCRADLLGDDFEGSVSIPTIKNRRNFFEGATDNYINAGIPATNKLWRKHVFISCWHANVNESALMWRAYSEKNKSIALRTSIQKLMNSIQEEKRGFIVSPINYINYNIDRISEANAFYPYLHKQNEYEAEREFRVITDNLEELNLFIKNENERPKGLLIKVNISSLIESVIISPFADAAFNKEALNLLEKHKISDKLIESSISKVPKF